MKVEKQNLLNKLQSILDRNDEDEENPFLTDDERWTLVVTIAVIEGIEDE